MKLVEEAFRLLESTKHGKPADFSVMQSLTGMGIDDKITDKWWDQVIEKLMSSYPDLSEEEIVKFMNTAGSRFWLEVWNLLPSIAPGQSHLTTRQSREEMVENKVKNANSGKLNIIKVIGGTPLADLEKLLIKWAKTTLKKVIKKKNPWD